jgi:hypothetical protein
LKKVKVIKIRFKDANDEEYLAYFVFNKLKGTSRNSSGCWEGNYFKLWYLEDENKTYIHFPSDPCYTWEGNVVKEIAKQMKEFIRKELPKLKKAWD